MNADVFKTCDPFTMSLAKVLHHGEAAEATCDEEGETR